MRHTGIREIFFDGALIHICLHRKV